MGQSKRITDGAMLIAVYIVLLLLVMFIPFVVLIGLFVLPIPFIMYAARHDWKPSIMMLIATLIMSFIFATVVSLPLTILAGIGGIVIGTAIKRQIGVYDIWARGSVGFVIGLVLVVIFTQIILGVSLTAEMDSMMQESMQFTKVLMENFGLMDGDQEQLKLIEEQMEMFIDLLPSSIAVMGILMAFVSQWLSYQVINRIERTELKFPPFRKFNLPTSVVWFYFIILILSFLDLSQDNALYLVVINAIAILTILLIIQGFSFVFFYAHYKGIAKIVPIIFVVVSFIFPFILLFFIRLLGIIDIGFSLKKRVLKSKTDK